MTCGMQLVAVIALIWMEIGPAALGGGGLMALTVIIQFIASKSVQHVLLSPCTSPCDTSSVAGSLFSVNVSHILARKLGQMRGTTTQGSLVGWRGVCVCVCVWTQPSL